jgi:hypothetical protein
MFVILKAVYLNYLVQGGQLYGAFPFNKFPRQIFKLKAYLHVSLISR